MSMMEDQDQGGSPTTTGNPNDDSTTSSSSDSDRHSRLRPLLEPKRCTPSELSQRAVAVWKKTQQASSSSSSSISSSSTIRHKRPIFIAVAGGPGSGKSTIAEQVCLQIQKDQHDLKSLVIPMDGYHYSQAQLKELAEGGHFAEEACSGGVHSFQEAMKHRGDPWTFDSDALCRDLLEAKRTGRGTFPIYDRSISDPVPDGVTFTQEHDIVLVEGIYLLALDEPRWNALKDVWDEAWYIHVDQSTVETRLIERHLKNWTPLKVAMFGEGRSGARRKVQMADWPNFVWIEQHSRKFANLVIDNN